MSQPRLDDTDWLVSRLGGEGVLTSVRSLKQQIITGLGLALDLHWPYAPDAIHNVVLCGMGGSRFPGIILQYAFRSEYRVPLEICDDYVLPGSVGKNTLVILGSYSGTTEEVLSLAHDARDRQAMVSGYCVGGALAEFFRSQQSPHIVFTQEHNPSHQPRMGFGYALGCLLGICARASLIRGMSAKTIAQQVERGLSVLGNEGSSFDVVTRESDNPAKTLASKLVGRYPYYIVAEHMVGVGNCMQNQTNETAKNISSFRVVPELNHHMMEGLKYPPSHHREALFVLFLSELYRKRIQQRMQVTQDVIRQNKIEMFSYTLRAPTVLGQVGEGLLFASYTTMYLAALYGEDPEAIPFVDYFKRELNKLPF